MRELYSIVYEVTKEFLEQRKVEDDVRKIIEAEYKYKQAFRELQDKRSQVLDYENQYHLHKISYEKVNEEIQVNIMKLQKECD